MERAVLFCNGDLGDVAFHRALLKEDDLIVAVDGGGRHCDALNIVPDLAVGDFDSLPPDLRRRWEGEHVEWLPYPADKDYIDTVLAAKEARRRGREHLLILGAFGGTRVDMFLGNLLLLTDLGENAVMQNEFSEARLLRGGDTAVLRGSIGDYVSLLPLSGTVTAAVSEGLKYPLEGLTFRRGESRSISNELTTSEASLTLSAGEAILILQKR